MLALISPTEQKIIDNFAKYLWEFPLSIFQLYKIWFNNYANTPLKNAG